MLKRHCTHLLCAVWQWCYEWLLLTLRKNCKQKIWEPFPWALLFIVADTRFSVVS